MGFFLMIFLGYYLPLRELELVVLPASGVAGLVCAITSCVRKEQPVSFAIIGFLLNAAFLAFLAYLPHIHLSC